MRKGSKSGASMKCAGCQGSSMKVSIRQLGPGMIQQMQHVCPDCKGSGQFKAINDEGMPMYQSPFMKGKLYIHFLVDFPESGSLSPDQCRALEAILPPKPSNEMTDMELDECEETILQDVNMEEEMRRKQQQHIHEAYEEEEEGGSGPRVQCAQQ